MSQSVVLRRPSLSLHSPAPAPSPSPRRRWRRVDVAGQSPYGLVGPKNMRPEIVDAIHQAFRQAMTQPKVNEYLAKFTHRPWNKNPAEYRAFAEKCYVDVKPLLTKAGLAKA